MEMVKKNGLFAYFHFFLDGRDAQPTEGVKVIASIVLDMEIAQTPDNYIVCKFVTLSINRHILLNIGVRVVGLWKETKEWSWRANATVANKGGQAYLEGGGMSEGGERERKKEEGKVRDSEGWLWRANEILTLTKGIGC